MDVGPFAIRRVGLLTVCENRAGKRMARGVTFTLSFVSRSVQRLTGHAMGGIGDLSSRRFTTLSVSPTSGV